jgi:hypothetical protein
MWVSGPITACLVCQSTHLHLTRERFILQDQVYIGTLTCLDCDSHLLDSRRKTQPRPVYRGDVQPRKDTRRMKLFNVAKVGLYLDTITHATEKRQDAEVKIVTLTLRVQPFDVQLAAAMPDGVRATLFKMTSGDPKDTLRRVDFALGVPRQNLHIFAAPDTGQPSIVLTQVKIGGTYARTEKAVSGYGFVVKASFGPVGRTELEYICDWHLGQRFVTFEEAEPGFFDSDETEDEDDGPAPSTNVMPAVPAPMFEDPRDMPATAQDRAQRPLHRHSKTTRGRATR